VESLSAYARQFLGRMNKPECDSIKGIPPAIAIEQRVNTRNPRSTVGTSTEIYEYMRLLYARVGKTISPISGEKVKATLRARRGGEDAGVPRRYPPGRVSPRSASETDEPPVSSSRYLMKEGFTRVDVGEQFYRIEELLEQKSLPPANEMLLVIDRLSCSSDKATINRLSDSVETALSGRER